MFGLERLQLIREILREKKSIEVISISQELGVSEVTIRRDLDKLEKEGFAIKTYGGALLKEDKQNSKRTETIENIADGYVNIVQTANHIIEDGDTIFLGGNKINVELAKVLTERNGLIIVTNNIEIATICSEKSANRVIILGGMIDPVTGNVEENALLERLLIEKSFICVEGIDQTFGYTVNNKSDIDNYRSLKKVSRRVIVLSTSGTFGKRGLIQMAPLLDIKEIVTDKHIPDVFKTFYFENDVKVYASMVKH